MGEGHPCTTPTAFSCFSSVTTMVGPIKRGDGGGGGGGFQVWVFIGSNNLK